eukprot:186826_1
MTSQQISHQLKDEFKDDYDSPQKLTVYGFIHELENKYRFYYPIPGGIFELCILFYYEFGDYLLYLMYGNNRDWIQQQQQIRNYFIEHHIDLKKITKSEFSHILLSLTNYMYDSVESSKLYKSLLKKPADDVCDDIISAITSFRNEQREKCKTKCIKKNINKNSMSSKKKALIWLTKNLTLSRIFRSYLIIKMFGVNVITVDVTDNFHEWICDVIFNKNDEYKLNKRIANYFYDNSLNHSMFLRYSQNTRQIQKIKDDFEAWFDIQPLTANNLYEILLTKAQSDTLSIDKLVKIACGYLSNINELNRKDIIKKCKENNINNHKLFIEQYGKSTDDLMIFLKEILQLKCPNHILFLIQYKLHFYFTESFLMNIHGNKQFILWQAKLIYLMRMIRLFLLFGIHLKLEHYDARSLVSITYKDFCKKAENFGIRKGQSFAFIRPLKQEITADDSLNIILGKVAKIVYGHNIDAKKFDNAIKRADYIFMKSINDVNFDNVRKLIFALSPIGGLGFINDENGYNDLLNEMNLCLSLFKMNQLNHH